MPLWSNHLQSPPELFLLKSKNAEKARQSERTIVYFPACISLTMGTYEGQEKKLMGLHEYLQLSKNQSECFE